MSLTRVLLADDHTLLLDGLRRLLESEFEVVGTVTNGHDLVTAAKELRPDVVVLDISMPQGSGLEAARQLTESGSPVKIVFLTMHRDPNYVKEAFRAGAAGYVLKHAAGSELVGALREVMSGHFYLSPLVSRGTLMELLGSRSERSGCLQDALTTRQREVLRCVAGGHASKVIAGILGISQKTVEFHRASLKRQLGLQSTAELTRYAVMHGLIED